MKFNLVEGTLELIQPVAKGSSATIWTSQLKIKGKKPKKFVTKRIHKNRNEIVGVYNWKKAGMIIAPQKTRAPLKLNCITLDLDFDFKNLKKDECVLSMRNAYAEWKKDDAIKLSLRTNYITECMIAKVLRKKVSPFLPVPIFCRIKANFSTLYHHNIVMDYAGSELETMADDLTLNEFKSIVLQVLIALSWSQHLVKFKHHDLHPGNVYFKYKKISQNWKLPSGKEIMLPSNNVEAIIADFGLSVANVGTTRIGRLDFPLLSTDNNKKWGEWDYDLVGNEGYDVIVLLDSLKDDTVGKQYEWIKQLLDKIKEKLPTLKISSINRPLCKVNITPEEILDLAIGR